MGTTISSKDPCLPLMPSRRKPALRMLMARSLWTNANPLDFFLNEQGARNAAKEVLATHKGLTGEALKGYLDTYFAKAWAHFDVNKAGVIEVSKAPQFMRFLASDQRMSLGESSF